MYIISIIAAVAGNIELPSLNCEFKSYNTFEDAVVKVETEINERYANNDSFLDFKIQLPRIAYFNGCDFISNGYFKCQYVFGPMVRYNIVIRKISPFLS